MWNNYIGSEIRRSNRNLLITNTILVLITGGILAASWRYLYNSLAGPFPVAVDSLAGIKNPGALSQYFVAVHGVQAKDAGLQIMDQRVSKYSRKVTSETLSAVYFAFPVRTKVMLVKSPKTTAAADYEGAIVPVPQDVRDWYQTKMRARNLEFDDVFLPYMLDATSFRTAAYWELALCLPFLALGLFNLFKGITRASNPAASPIAKQLALIGPPEQVAAAIQNEMAQYGNRSTLKGTLLTASWLTRSTPLGLKVMHLNDILWVYQKVTKHSTNGVPTGTTFSVTIGDRAGERFECGGKQPEVVKFIETLYAGVPWVVTGYSAELNTKFTKHRQEFAAIVQQRREQLRQPR
jgi:hypothetical protein